MSGKRNRPSSRAGKATHALEAGSTALATLLAVVMFVVFAIVGVWLLLLGFEIGGVYPEYSSHRSELNGTAVLYEALELIPGCTVTRSYTDLHRVPEPGEAAIFLPGLVSWRWNAMSREETQDVAATARAGARLILAFRPEPRIQLLPVKPSDRNADKPAPKPPTPQPELVFEARYTREEIKAPGGKVEFEPLRRSRALLYSGIEVSGLPESLRWQGSSHFSHLSPHWKVVYSRDTLPVVIERRYGRGSIVMCTDASLLTNRAMWENRETGLLVWLVGSKSQVVFSEKHLGVADDPGIAWLLRRHNLHGLVLAILILLGLTIWRKSVPFTPIPAPSGADRLPDPGSSLASLLRRSIGPGQLLQLCVQEWKKSRKADRSGGSTGVEKVFEDQQAKHPRRHDPVVLYNQLTAVSHQLTAVSGRRLAVSEQPSAVSGQSDSSDPGLP